MRHKLTYGIVAFLCFALSSQTANAAEQLVSRTIIALYSGGDLVTSYIHTVAEMPINHLGLTIEYHDIHDPLPDLTQRSDVRGVITWFLSDTHLDPDMYSQWALNTMNAGKKFVVIGSPGISTNAQQASTSELINQFLAKLGIRMLGQWVDKPFDVTYEYKTPNMFLTRAPYDWLRPPYEKVQTVGDQMQAHLIAHRNDGDSDLIVTGPNGGYVADGYIFRTNDQERDVVAQWLIDPFQFFRVAYATDDLPKPDTTTIAGRRIYYSHIDGDGWNNVTQLEEYRDKNILSARVILEKVIKAYPDMPIMVAIIAADIDPAWVAIKDSRTVAREILALPQVEAGTHTYSHPFYWQFFKNGNWINEASYLRFYPNPTWQPTEDIREKATREKPPDVPPGYRTPRAYATQPFDINKEIHGSLQEIAPLLPKGKRVEILAWPGNCAPWEAVVRMTRDEKIQNINGGDSRFDLEYPAYASLASIGKQVGNERQIYSSSSNENTYTELWSKNFFAYTYLKKTLMNSETPLRLKPIDLYYHVYSGEREASLNALISNLEYARAQNIAPLTTSHYTHIAEGFYTTQMTILAADRWRIDDRGELQTIRFDHTTLKSVDFKQSSGVIGERHLQGSLYVYLDSAVTAPIIALKNDDDYFAPAKEDTPYLIESRWLLSDFNRDRNQMSFQAQGYGAGEMIFQVPVSGVYSMSVNGKYEATIIVSDRILRVKLSKDAMQPPLSITITGPAHA